VVRNFPDADESPYAFPGGDKEIVQQVMLEQQVAQGEIMEIDDESDDDNADPDDGVTRRETIDLVTRLERLAIRYGAASSDTLELNRLLRKFRAHLHHEDSVNSKQTTLNTFFGPVVQ